LGLRQQFCHLGAVLGVFFVQRVQQQNVADVEHIHIQFIPRNVLFAETCIAAAAVVEGALLGDLVGHNQSERGSAGDLYMLQVDVVVLFQLLHNVSAGFVVTGAAQCYQRQFGVQLCQVHDVVAQAAADGFGSVLGDGGQFTGLGDTGDGIEHIHDHIACYSNAFFVHNDDFLSDL